MSGARWARCGEAAGSGGGFERAPRAEGPPLVTVMSVETSSGQSASREGEGRAGMRGVGCARSLCGVGGRGREGSRSERQGRPGGEGGEGRRAWGVGGARKGGRACAQVESSPGLSTPGWTEGAHEQHVQRSCVEGTCRTALRQWSDSETSAPPRMNTLTFIYIYTRATRHAPRATRRAPTPKRFVFLLAGLRSRLVLRDARVPRAACRVPRAACLVPRAACRVPRAARHAPCAGCLVPRASCHVPRASCHVRAASPGWRLGGRRRRHSNVRTKTLKYNSRIPRHATRRRNSARRFSSLL